MVKTHATTGTQWGMCHVDIDLLARTYAEQVFVIHWNYPRDKELQYIGWPYEQCFSLSFCSKPANFTCCYHHHCDLIHLGIPTEVVLSIDPQIKSTGLLLEWHSLRQWYNHVYVGVTQLRNSSRFLSLTELAIMQESRMSPLGCWRNSNFHLTYEPCLCKGCYWGVWSFVSVTCQRSISCLKY